MCVLCVCVHCVYVCVCTWVRVILLIWTIKFFFKSENIRVNLALIINEKKSDLLIWPYFYTYYLSDKTITNQGDKCWFILVLSSKSRETMLNKHWEKGSDCNNSAIIPPATLLFFLLYLVLLLLFLWVNLPT